MRIRAYAKPVTLGLLAAVVVLSCGEGVDRGGVPSYTDAPVFYDLFWEHWADVENLELVHEGKVKLGSLGVRSIDGFDWSQRQGQSGSYWILMENFWYLTPLIHSTAERDQAFVREWFEGWLDAHHGKPWENTGAKDRMSVGLRVMTFAWYLRLLHERGEVDPDWIARITESIKEHQRFLAEKFVPVSNHGYWEAMGLFESTRVCPDTAMTRLALQRLDRMVADGVTAQGFYVERSPSYQIQVLEWITGYVEYFRALGFEWPGREKLETAQRKMEQSLYYLFDHDGNVPQIGDTDADRLDREHVPGMPAVFFDQCSGYAVYKDAEIERGRYVVFIIPSVECPSTMTFHSHDDALSVYYSHQGEVILGDAGRYSYTADRNRRYFRSAAAHNTVVSESQSERTRKARAVSGASARQEVEFYELGASLEQKRVTRVVRVPRDHVALEVIDAIADDGTYAILWHLGVDVESVQRIDARDRGEINFELTTAAQRRFLLTITTDAGPPGDRDAVEVVSGRMSPMQGWYSPSHERKVPVPVITLNLEVRGAARVKTTITAR